MATAVIEVPKGVVPPPSGIGTLGAYFQSTPASDQLVRSDERLIQELLNVLDRQLIAAVDAHSDSEFRDVRRHVMPRYVRGLRALNDTALNLVSDATLQHILESVSTELADDLEKQRDTRFGDKLTEQALFTLWTIQNIRNLRREISHTGEAADDKRGEENKLRYEYHAASMWAQFHLDVLFAAIRFDRPISEEIKETICDGLRAAVNAFVIMKDVLVLRQPQAEHVEPPLRLPWDEEDELLLASSMRDRNANSSAER